MAVTQIINGETYIQIESNTIVSPGSPPPDIDTDFHTEHRDDGINLGYITCIRGLHSPD